MVGELVDLVQDAHEGRQVQLFLATALSHQSRQIILQRGKMNYSLDVPCFFRLEQTQVFQVLVLLA